MRTGICALAALALAVAGCRGDGARSASGAPAGPRAQALACEPPFARDARGVCAAVLPPAACPPGTRATPGSADCAPTGFVACPPGFALDASGWACLDVLPDVACAGATREVLGSRTCRRIGDCAAPFPPAEATLFVDDDGPLGADRFRSIAAAYAAAPAGATIAVESGTYAESVLLKKPVRIVGRCAAEVALADNGVAEAGVRVNAPVAVAVTGMTIVGHDYAAAVASGGDLTLERVVLEANHGGGLIVGDGSMVRVRDAAIRGSLPDLSANAWGKGVDVFGGASLELTGVTVSGSAGLGLHVSDAGTRATLQDVVLRDLAPTADGEDGRAILVFDGGALSARRVAIVKSRGWGVAVDAKSSASFEDAVIRDTVPSKHGATPLEGRGLELWEGAAVSLTRVTLAANREIALQVGPGHATLRDVSIVRTRTTAAGRGGSGIEVADHGVLDADGTALVSNHLAGVTVTSGAEASLRRSRVTGTLEEPVNSVSAAVYVDGGAVATLEEVELGGDTQVELYAEGTVTASKLYAHDCVPNAESLHGIGIILNYGAKLSLSDSVVRRSRVAGVGLLETGTAADVRNTEVDQALPSKTDQFGYGFVLESRSAPGPQLTCEACRLYDNRVGLVVSLGSAAVAASVLAGNAVAVHAQGGVAVRQVDAVEPLAPLDVQLRRDTDLSQNGTALGTGEVPLPPAPK